MENIAKAKRVLLDNIQGKIKVLQDGYNTILNLPDDLFEQASLIANNGLPSLTSINDFENSNQEHGFIRKTIISILQHADKPLTKNQIVSQFSSQFPDKEGEKTVRYALNGLKNKGEVKGYKPKNKRIQGYLWTLAEWWDGNELKFLYQNKK